MLSPLFRSALIFHFTFSPSTPKAAGLILMVCGNSQRAEGVHRAPALSLPMGSSPYQPAMRLFSSSSCRASPVVVMLFQNRIAEGTDTDQRGAASPHAQAILCRSFTRPTGLWVSGIGVRPQAQRKISSRHMLMALYWHLSMPEGRAALGRCTEMRSAQGPR